MLILLLFTPAGLIGQSPFDGTWVLNQITVLPEKPTQYLLSKRVFRCSGCIVNVEIEADGFDHKVDPADYWDTINVQIVDLRTVEIIAKKAGRTTYTEVDVVSLDGTTLTQVVKDTTEADTVTTETVGQRLEDGPGASHALSGSWRAYKVNRSSNGSVIKYRCTADGFSGETPLGEKFDAKFDGNFYPVEDDPGQTMVSAKLIGPATVELTHKRKGKIVSVSRMSVTPDGQTIHVAFENKEANSTTSFDFQKQR